jgi:hypothetical protein
LPALLALLLAAAQEAPLGIAIVFALVDVSRRHRAYGSGGR